MASSIPIEVVTHIFKYLAVSDRKEASLVCHSWYEASLDPSLQKDIVVNFLGNISSQDVSGGLIRRKLTHLVLNQIENTLTSNENLIQSCQNLSQGLKSLSLKGANITEKTFISLVSHFTNLENLDLTCCNSLFMSGKILEKSSDVELLKHSLKNVKTLTLSSIRFLSDSTFNRIVSVCQNVQNLSIASAQITFNSHAYYPEDTKVCDSPAIFSFQNILFYLQQQNEKIKSLNLSRISITDPFLAKISQVEGLNLKELILSNCRDLTSHGIIEMCSNQKNIEKIDVSYCIDVGDKGIVAITLNLNNLKTLMAKKCQRISDVSAKMLKNLPCVDVLDLSECYNLTSDGLIQGLCSGIQSHLTHLNLRCCSSLTDSIVVELCKYVPGLQYLDLGSCFPLTDLSVQSISKNLKNLKHLCLTWCKEITDLGLIGFQNVELNMDTHADHGDHGQCRCTRRKYESTIFRKPTGELQKKKLALTQLEARVKTEEERCRLNNIAGLQSLDLSSCEKLTDVSIKEVIKFSGLRSLNLSSVHGLTNASVIAIANGNPSLEEIQFQQCPKITDSAMEVLIEKCPRLTYINVASCDLLTNVTLYNIQINCHRLRHLDVSFCKNMTPEGVDKVEASIKCLTNVQRRLVGAF
ncbi:hypothetical protein SNE40_008454 [Patella caerulea]|uniref:F-box domain-containing protein n=1 Tax=Patella caerulea TaxID=87958 RepID=A0AAN8K144_PATCE